MLSVAAMAGGQETYYLSLAAEDYYVNGGEPVGRWLGRGAEALGLVGDVTKTALRNLFLGFAPDGSRPLVQQQRTPDRTRQPGWDLTFSAPKSVSVLWSQIGAPERRVIERAHFAAVQKALAEFKGVGRRFQRHGELPAQGGGRFAVIDDYGHHPVEMAATLAAARGAFPGQRLVLAFQPHRYTRTRDCFEDFVRVLGGADHVLLTEVYAAGEEPIVAADGRSLARALRVAGRVEPLFVDDVAELPRVIAEQARDGDVVLCMGAGSIGAVPARLVEMLQKNERVMAEGRRE